MKFILMIFGESIVLHELLNLLITGGKILKEKVFLLNILRGKVVVILQDYWHCNEHHSQIKTLL